MSKDKGSTSFDIALNNINKITPKSLLLQRTGSQNHATVGNNLIILSSMPELFIGDTEGLPSDYDGGSIMIFANNVVLRDNLKAKNALISAHAIISGEKIIDVSGIRGLDDTAGNENKSLDGAAGGTLLLFTEVMGGTPTIMRACGGDGGNGKAGSYEKAGGNGGNGGNGGRVEYFFVDHYSYMLQEIGNIYKETDLAVKHIGIKMLFDQLGDNVIFGNLGKIIKKLKDEILKPGSRDFLDIGLEQLNSKLFGTVIKLDASKNLMLMNQEKSISIGGGRYGVYGEGTPNGKNGIDGNGGNIDLRAASRTEELLEDTLLFKSTNSTAFAPLLIHPAQYVMNLNQLKFKYMLVNTNQEMAFKSTIAELGAGFKRLYDNTAVFVNIEKKPELKKYWDDHEKTIGSVNSIRVFNKINLEAKSYLNNLKNGLNFFGYKSNYVPFVQITDIQKVAQELIIDFKVIHDAYEQYFTELKDDNKRKQQVQILRSSINKSLSQIQSDLKVLSGELVSSQRLIEGFKDILENKKQRVEENMKKYLEAVKGHFDFDIKSLLEAASTIAFTPKSAGMWIIQASKLVYSGMSEVTDVQGQPVKKEFIVQKITAIEANLKKISEGHKVSSDDTIKLEDEGANKLLAEQQQMEKILDEFYGKFPPEAEELRTSIQDYIQIVTKRNTQVLTYNAYVSVLQHDYQMQESIKQQQEEMRDELIDKNDPGLPSIAAFALEAVGLARNNIIQIMDLASRAYKFWTLDSENLLGSVIGRDTALEINHSVLHSFHSNFWSKYTLKVIDRGPSGSKFADIKYSVSDSLSIKTLQKNHEVSFTIPPQRHKDPGVFGQMAEIRISKVQAYLPGVKLALGEDILKLSIKHGGEDNFITSANLLVNFTHQAVNQPFHYNINDVKCTSPHAGLGAEFGISSFTQSRNNDKQAVLGPFTTWTIEILPEHHKHKDLDLTGVTAIDLIFEGTSNGFT